MTIVFKISTRKTINLYNLHKSIHEFFQKETKIMKIKDKLIIGVILAGLISSVIVTVMLSSFYFNEARIGLEQMDKEESIQLVVNMKTVATTVGILLILCGAIGFYLGKYLSASLGDFVNLAEEIGSDLASGQGDLMRRLDETGSMASVVNVLLESSQTLTSKLSEAD